MTDEAARPAGSGPDPAASLPAGPDPAAATPASPDPAVSVPAGPDPAISVPAGSDPSAEAASPVPAGPGQAAPAGDLKAGGSPRRRDSAATRAAILRAAIDAFTRSGYDGAGVREIASAAGVTAMLVNRYFGSKEQLFAEAVDVAFAPRTVVGRDPATVSADIAGTLAARTAPAADVLSPFLLMLHSAGNPRAAQIIRAGIEAHVGRDLAALLPGPGADERAELLLGVIAGVWLLRKVIATTALASVGNDALAAQLRAIIDVVVAQDQGP